VHLPPGIPGVAAQGTHAYEGMSPEQAAAAWVLWPLMAQQRAAHNLG
jgi:hypothetical protein